MEKVEKIGHLNGWLNRVFLRLLSCGLIFLFFVKLQYLYCQNSGLKYIKNYTTYQHSQNWSVLQDKRGIIYVANSGCVLEYDGNSLRIVNIPGWKVRSIAMDDDGTVYVGGVNQLGYLAPNANGAFQYVSLVDYLVDDQKNFSIVLRINTTNDGVYFRTRKFLFRWKPNAKKMEVWEPEKEFNASFKCNGRLFIHQRKVGLMEMVDNSLKMIYGDEIFASVKIYMIAPYTPGAQKVLIGTRSKGFFVYDGMKAVPFHTEADDYVRQKQLYHGIRLVSTASTGEFALATQQGGLVIIDGNGKLKQIFTKATGLLDNVVNYVFEDFQGNLWLALDKGLAKIEYASPITFYNEELTNLPGIVYSIIRHGYFSSLLVGTSSGLHVLRPPGSPGNPAHFRAVPGITGNCWDLLSVDDSLLAASSGGTFILEKDLLIKEKVIQLQSFVLHHSTKIQHRILVGTRKGLFSLRRENQKWVEDFHFKNITEAIRTLVEAKNGNLWLGTEADGVLKVDFPEVGEILHPVVTRYKNSHGLPGGEVRVFMAAEHVIFAAGDKLYRFDEKNRIFVPDFILGEEFTDGSRSVFTLIEDNKKNIWFHSEFRNFQALTQPDRTFFIQKQPFLRIPPAQVNVIYPDPGDDVVWFGGQGGLIRYDNGVNKNYNQNFTATIREVVVNGTPQMYDESSGRYKINHAWQEKLPIFQHKDRNFTFKFAAPSFEDEDSNKFRCMLEGYEETWSEWTSEAKRVYTNLGHDLYTFRVQAKNVYDQFSREDIIRFKVLPPWYWTLWAFSVYGLAAFLFMFLVVKWRSGKLEREKKRLEKTIQVRTKEIDEKNRQLQKQTLQLLEQSEQLKELDQIKSRFFANISHEFRTPLTLIIGPLEQSLAKTHDDEEKKRIQMMLRNSRRLLQLINQLLDLSKIDSGKMKLQACRQNIVPFLKGITASFEVMARQKGLDLSFNAAEEIIILYIDVQKMEVVMYNLLANAIRFTPARGKITITVKKSERDFVTISICDTGIGIPKEQLARIFERFYQAEESPAITKGNSSPGNRDDQGTGIGLALTRELVLLHHGTIDVKSSVGKESGTDFIIRLQLGKKHLNAEDIVIPSEVSSMEIKPTELTAFYAVEDRNNGDEPTEMDKEDELGTGNKEIILVVEDCVDMRDYIKRTLEPFYSVKEAGDGNEGIKKAKKIIPDLVISDIMMPGADGYELCNVLKDDIKTSHIPIILLTAKASEANIIQGLETGADDYITKPFSTKILLARIKNLIDLRRQWQQKMQRVMNLKPAEVQVSSMDQKFIKEVMEVIEKNLSDEFFNVGMLGKKLYMSRTTLYRKIQALTGQSPREFIKSYRLKRGAQLLKGNFGNVTEVAFEVGFSSTTYFSKCFKEKFQQLPSAFHNSDRKPDTA